MVDRSAPAAITNRWSRRVQHGHAMAKRESGSRAHLGFEPIGQRQRDARRHWTWRPGSSRSASTAAKDESAAPAVAWAGAQVLGAGSRWMAIFMPRPVLTMQRRGPPVGARLRSESSGRIRRRSRSRYARGCGRPYDAGALRIQARRWRQSTAPWQAASIPIMMTSSVSAVR
jgi:hypothetical protein